MVCARTNTEQRHVSTLYRCSPPDKQAPLNSPGLEDEPPAPIASLLTISSTFDSLFKVLFIFPSRYLFAIGLSLTIFSLGWDLPPA